MKIVKSLSIVLLAISSLSLAAQEKTTDRLAPERAKRNANRLKMELSLSDEQTKRVEVINMKFMNDLNNEMNGDDKKAPEKQDGVSREDALKQILTPEQFAKFLENKALRKEKIKAQRNKE